MTPNPRHSPGGPSLPPALATDAVTADLLVVLAFCAQPRGLREIQLELQSWGWDPNLEGIRQTLTALEAKGWQRPSALFDDGAGTPREVWQTTVTGRVVQARARRFFVRVARATAIPKPVGDAGGEGDASDGSASA